MMVGIWASRSEPGQGWFPQAGSGEPRCCWVRREAGGSVRDRARDREAVSVGAPGQEAGDGGDLSARQRFGVHALGLDGEVVGVPRDLGPRRQVGVEVLLEVPGLGAPEVGAHLTRRVVEVAVERAVALLDVQYQADVAAHRPTVVLDREVGGERADHGIFTGVPVAVSTMAAQSIISIHRWSRSASSSGTSGASRT